MMTTLFVLIFLAFMAWMAAIVCRRAGLSPLWGLLVLVPLVNLAAIWVFAFAEWPALDDPPLAGGDAPFEP